MGLLLHQGTILSSLCLFNAAQYLMYSMNPLGAWQLFNAASVACYSCLSKGDVADSSDKDMDTVTKNQEQRLYWTCLKSERCVLSKLCSITIFILL